MRSRPVPLGRAAAKTVHPLRRRAVALVLPLALCLVACDASPSDGPGAHALLIEASFEAAPAVGRNTLALTVTDLDATPVSGASIVVSPQMPSHGHGSTESPTVTDLGGGAYRAHPVTFQMPGPWVVQIRATDAEGRTGAYDLHVEVP